jgi:hypothetical protein
MSKWFSKDPDEKKEQPPDDQSKLLDAFAAKFEEVVKPLRESVTALQTEWNAIKEEAGKTTETSTTSTTELSAEEKQNQNNRALLEMNIQTRAMIIERDCLNALSGDWAHLKPQLTEMFAKTSSATKAMPNYGALCHDAVHMLIGREAAKGGLRRDNSGRFFLEDANAKTGGEDSPLNQFEAWQSDDRTETAGQTLSKLGIDPERFASDLREGRLN